MNSFPKNKYLPTFLIGFLSIILNFSNVQASDWQFEFKNLDSLSKKTFLKGFDYNLYLENESLSKIDSLKSHRQLLIENQLDGDEFLYLLCEKYLEKYPIDVQNTELFENQIKVGEGFYNYSQICKDKKSKKVFSIMCDILLQELANDLEKSIAKKEVDKSEKEIVNFIKILNKCNYKINITETDKEKAIRNLKSGNWYYLWKRYSSRCLGDCFQGGDCNKMCWTANSLLIGFLVLIAALTFWKIRLKLIKIKD